MPRNTNRFQDLHDEYVDSLEYLATYGLDSLNDKEKEAAKKLAFLAEEYIDTMALEDPNYDVDKDEDDE